MPLPLTVLRGSYPDDLLALYERRLGPLEAIRDADLEVIARPIDFLGANYYSPARVRAEPSEEPLGAAAVPAPAPLTAMGWEVAPEGLYELLVRLRRDYGVPIAITENGAAFDAEGYATRFGIVHVDYETQRRTLKRSGAWYRDLIARTRDARRLG